MKVSFDGTGDVILITGGASGISRTLALRASEAGAQVVVFDVESGALEELRKQDPRIEVHVVDVGQRSAVFKSVGEVEARFGHIDGLVCGAAIQPRVLAHATPPELWESVLNVNLNGVVWCYQAVVPGMIARKRGSIIAFSSGLAHQGWNDASAYSATKGALIGFVKSAAKEIAKHRVRFNLIAPGVIDTPQYRAANAGADDARWRAMLGVGQPEDVAGPLLFLLSDAASMTASLLSRDFAYPA
jgi:2-hydroxycyclohexanecarboxyl-CoA dehydrogenase